MEYPRIVLNNFVCPNKHEIILSEAALSSFKLVFSGLVLFYQSSSCQQSSIFCPAHCNESNESSLAFHHFSISITSILSQWFYWLQPGCSAGFCDPEVCCC